MTEAGYGSCALGTISTTLADTHARMCKKRETRGYEDMSSFMAGESNH